MAKTGPKPARIIVPLWTPELAYACGLIATDGCLISDGRHIDLTSKDIELLETFKKCLNINNRISWKTSGYKGELRPRIQFSDVVLYRWLVSIGITSRKSKTIGKIKVPDSLFFDYLRGEFDGDGTSYAYWDTRWRSSVSLYMSFACASKKHLEWLNQKICHIIGVSGYIAFSVRSFHLTFSKNKARMLFGAMYYSSDIPFLKRKKKKLDRQWAAEANAKQGKQPARFIRGGSVLRIA